MDGRDAVFTAGPSAGRLSVSCFTDWDDLYEFLRTSFDEAANAPVPSSVRGPRSKPPPPAPTGR